MVLVQSCGGGGGGDAGTPGPGSTDTTRPYIVLTSPANNATGVAVDAVISASFSETISSSTPQSAFTLMQGSTAVIGTVSYSGNTATFTPAAPLGTSQTYSATLSTAVKDLAGNALASTHSWTFIASDCRSISLVRQFDLGAAAAGNGFKTFATDGTSVYLYEQEYLASNGTLLKINPQTDQITGTSNIPLVSIGSTTLNAINFVADITWHGNALWASGTYIGIDAGSQTVQALQGIFKVNLDTGLSETQIPVAPGLAGEVVILQGLASDGTYFYAGIDRNYQVPTPAEHVIVKFNPATSTQIPLAPTLLTTDGQITRLSYGGGYLWSFVNPNFEKVDPVSGNVLSNYCKNDGGANILFFNDTIWTIQNTTVMIYSLQ